MIVIVEEPGNAREHRRIAGLPHKVYRGIRQGWFRVGHKMRAEAQQNILKGPKTGRFYRIRGRKRRHQASAPGESPANLSGNLRRSVGFQMQGIEQFEFGYRTSGGGARTGFAEYGKFLELGTERMQPRPNLSKVVKNNQRNVQRYMNAAIQVEHMQGR